MTLVIHIYPDDFECCKRKSKQKKYYYQYAQCLSKYILRTETQEFCRGVWGRGIKLSIRHSDEEMSVNHYNIRGPCLKELLFF